MNDSMFSYTFIWNDVRESCLIFNWLRCEVCLFKMLKCNSILFDYVTLLLFILPSAREIFFDGKDAKNTKARWANEMKKFFKRNFCFDIYTSLFCEIMRLDYKINVLRSIGLKKGKVFFYSNVKHILFRFKS